MADTTALVMLILRWVHFVAGITWIGFLYWFNLVNVPTQKVLDGPTKLKVNPPLLLRSLWWFRWGAAITVLAGILLMDQMARIGGRTWGDFAQTPQGQIIMTGGLLGIIMALNVWLVIWPNQRKVLAAVQRTATDGTPAPPEQPKWMRQAYLASRANFVLSFPMLVMMGSSSHYATDRNGAFILGAVAAIGGLIWVWYLGQPKKTPTPAAAPPTTSTQPGNPNK